MSRSPRGKRIKQYKPPGQKRLSTRQRWKWGILFAFAFGLVLLPYVMHIVQHPDPAKTVILVLIAAIGIHLYAAVLKRH